MFCNGCGKNLLVEHAISFPKGGLVLARYDDTEKELGSLGAWVLVSSSITYKPKYNGRTV